MNHLLPENACTVRAALHIYKSEVLFCAWQDRSELSRRCCDHQKSQEENVWMVQTSLIGESVRGLDATRVNQHQPIDNNQLLIY